MKARKKRIVSVDIDSALGLMQEIYNELCENRETALLIQKKMLSFMKDVEDLQTLGPIIKEQQKILNDTVEKKLQLSKLQTTILMKEEKAKTSGGSKLSMSASEREMLEALLDGKDEIES